jgi:hypothetical protein
VRVYENLISKVASLVLHASKAKATGISLVVSMLVILSKHMSPQYFQILNHCIAVFNDATMYELLRTAHHFYDSLKIIYCSYFLTPEVLWFLPL